MPQRICQAGGRGLIGFTALTWASKRITINHPDLNDPGVKNGGGSYPYDAAGRMTRNGHRGLTITYNHLDLPATITKGDVVTTILYDTTGRKWKQSTNAVTDATTRIYAGALTFQKVGTDPLTLEAANTADGRLVYDAEHKELYSEYYHKDHLGNVRLAFTDRNNDKKVELLGDASEITQQNDFYPFGLRQEGDGFVFHHDSGGNRYRYNGKELNEEVGLYDYGARWYDPAVGRWSSIDPSAENYYSMSPYNYVANNPINAIDPDGRDYILIFDHKNQTLTIRATYYTQSGDSDSANEAAHSIDLWNSQSGHFTYTIGKGKDAVDYAVNFDLKTQSVDDPAKEVQNDNAPFSVEGSLNPGGGSNLMTVAPDSDPDFKTKNPNSDGLGATVWGNLSKVKESSQGTDTGPHEVGHTLGAGHQASGIMTKYTNEEGRSNEVTKPTVKAIISNGFNQTENASGRIIHINGNPSGSANRGKLKRRKDD